MIHFDFLQTHRPDWTDWQPTGRVMYCGDGTTVAFEGRHCERCGRTQRRPGTVVSGPTLHPGSLDDGKWRRS